MAEPKKKPNTEGEGNQPKPPSEPKNPNDNGDGSNSDSSSVEPKKFRIVNKQNSPQEFRALGKHYRVEPRGDKKNGSIVVDQRLVDSKDFAPQKKYFTIQEVE